MRVYRKVRNSCIVGSRAAPPHPLYLDRDEARIMQEEEEEEERGVVGEVFVSNAPMRIAPPDISQSLRFTCIERRV